ncbi:MAG TPA: hypothetical protein VGK73_26860 [Polyangiaceae bacterium]
MAIRREKRVQMLFSDEEWAMLLELADEDGVTASDWVRLRVRQGYAEMAEPRRTKSKFRR